jgi:hypothetical protein
MSLHPWPSTEGNRPQRPTVLWKRVQPGAHALLIDSGAVPYCFEHETAAEEAARATDAIASLQCRHDAALARIRLLEAMLRDHCAC